MNVGTSTFATTHWSVVLAAREPASPQAAAALEELCRAYWYPLYAYVRRQGRSAHDAEDLLQSFFVRFLEKDFLHQVDRAKGRFRSFLLGALNHFLANEWDKARSQKRGGQAHFLSLDTGQAERWYGEDLASDLTPEKLYEQRWACVLLERVMQRLEHDSESAGKGDSFAALKGFLIGEDGGQSYPDLAAQFGVTEAALKMRVQRLRHRYQRLLREEIAQTVTSPEEVEDEIRHLFSILSSS
ncbi:MAG: sigma factor [Verrucomicrobiota bacterium]|jgi:RNA polymerase sigma-70 factor (ECF subfamily)